MLKIISQLPTALKHIIELKYLLSNYLLSIHNGSQKNGSIKIMNTEITYTNG